MEVYLHRLLSLLGVESNKSQGQYYLFTLLVLTA